MTGHPYIHERQVEYWTSREVETFFLDAGFEIRTFPITQLAEHDLPTDFLFFTPHLTKMFGFQYKALYGNSEDRWKIDKSQHDRLVKYPWLYYCLSELRRGSEQRLALHLARIVPPKCVKSDTISSTAKQGVPFYRRWGSFYNALRNCKVGVRVTDREHLVKLVAPDGDSKTPRELLKNLVDVFLADYGEQKLLHYSPQLRT